MRNFLVIILMSMSFNVAASENFDALALKHVEDFVALYGKKSVTIKKEDGKKYDKLRNELGTCATAEVLNNILDDQPEFSNNLSFSLSILFSIEANSYQVNKEFDLGNSYAIVEKEISEQSTKYLIERVGKSKITYEVQCGEKKENGIFGIQYSKDACLITNVLPKNI